MPGATMTMVGALARVGAQLAKERVRPPEPPRDLSRVPASADQLTPEWLTAALCRDAPGARVIGLEFGEGTTGSSARRALTATYNDAGTEAGLPTALFTKASPGFAARLVLGVGGMAEAECIFYRQVRPTLTINSPLGYYAVTDPRTFCSMIVLENVGVTRGATFGSALQALTREQAEDIVSQMAGYHGAYWQSEAFSRDLANVRSAEAVQEWLNPVASFKRRTLKGMDDAARVIPAGMHASRETIFELFMKSLHLHRSAPQTLLHEDVHPGNWYRDGEGRMGLYDWQALARGHWALDYSYATVAALRIEDRRAWEHDLLELYVDKLAAAGGPTLGFDEAWQGYRLQAIHGLVYWLFTIGRNPRFEPELQPDEYSIAIIERLAAMMDEHDSLAGLAAA
jgi:Phosphotransferase enzyme family